MSKQRIHDSDHQGISLMNKHLPTHLAMSKQRLPNKVIELHIAYAYAIRYTKLQINHHKKLPLADKPWQKILLADLL
jgi:hypothetical protein